MVPETYYVTSVKNDNMLVKFMTNTRKVGCFSWPSREDIQTVDTEFVLKTGFIPECMNSGRMWHISESELIHKLFTKFRAVFF